MPIFEPKMLEKGTTLLQSHQCLLTHQNIQGQTQITLCGISLTLTTLASTLIMYIFLHALTHIAITAEGQCSDASVMAALQDGDCVQGGGIPHTDEGVFANLGCGYQVFVRMDG